MSKHVLLLGATGTIGRATAKALLEDGHRVTCVLRPGREPDAPSGVEVKLSDGTPLEDRTYDAVISCIASRTGAPKDAWAVDHGLQSETLKQALHAHIPQFILLSAICVQKPQLEFQKAKLAFESELQASGIIWTIVRPTAFFKSLSGQIARVKAGKPYLVFGDGALTSCKPISDADLARFLSSCVTDPQKHNRILPIGGPGPALTPLQQGQALFEALGMEPKFRHVPVALISTIIAVLSGLGKLVPSLADKAQLARIGRYYATESMLVWDAKAGRYSAEKTPEFGNDTLADHFARAAQGKVIDDRGKHAVF